ncbi:MAG: FG-GAP-like repeat-containing protein [Candidatus Cloacimonadales bacterium]
MKKLLTIFMLILSFSLLTAQDVKLVDAEGAGDFTTLAAAIDYLNELAELPADGIIFNVTAGQTFTDSLSAITAVGTATAPIIFQKTGEGANPVIANEEQDNVIVLFLSAAYITFDSFDIVDPDPTNEARYLTGFEIDSSSNINILNSKVENFNKYGIDIGGGSVNCLVENNTIYYTEEYFTSETAIYGIKASYNSEIADIFIHKNHVYGIKESSSTVYGIEYNQISGEVINNMVSLQADNNDKIYGMRVVGRAGRTTNVLNNTVRISGLATDHGYALAILGAGGEVNIKNNILLNDRTEFDQYNVWFAFQYPGVDLDNNIYYSQPAEGFAARLGTTDYASLSDWQSASELDANSLVLAVDFADAVNDDLHLAGNALGNQDFIALASDLVTEDIDGEPRHPEYPYIGADENIDHPLAVYLESEYVIDNSGAGDFLSIAEAIETLNIGIIPAGGTTFQVTAGQTFTDSLATITAVATAEDPIIFQKSGEGDNPLLDYNYVDGIVLHFDNAAHITFDSIDITDATDDEIRYERAIYIYASENITIQNAAISNYNKYGAHIRDASVNTLIDGNEFFYTEEYFTDESTVYNIYVQYNAEADNATITNNKIYGIKEASATVYGIRVFKVNATVANNFISIADDNNDKIYALRLDAGTPDLVMDVLYNTVLLAGSASDDGYCLYRTGTDGLINLKNNILINNRTGEFEQEVINYTFVSGDWDSDYNVFYAAEGGVGYWGSEYQADLASWQAATEGDANTAYFAAEFVSESDLHLAGASLGNFDLAGLPIAGWETDIDGDLRHLVNPYKGADENLEYPLDPEDQYAILVEPTTLDWGENYLDAELEPLSFTIQNIGVMDLDVSSIAVTENFLIRLPEGEWSSQLENITLEPAEQLAVEVFCSNDLLGEITGDILVSSNAIADPEVNVDLQAVAIEAAISANPSELNLNQTINDYNSLAQSVTIYNENEMELNLDSITTTEGFMFSFNAVDYQSQLTDITLQDSLMIYVMMNFPESGDHTGELEIYSELAHGEDAGEIIALSGNTYNFQYMQTDPFMEGVWQSESVSGDFDNDGDYDILISGYALNSSTAEIYLYENNGNGQFSEVYVPDFFGTGFGCLDWIDVDNDNDLDIFLSGQHAMDNYVAKLYIYEDGEYQEIETNLPPLKGSNTDWKDFNGDGLLDVLFHGEREMFEQEDQPVTQIYINQGNGQFESLGLDIWQMAYGDAQFADYDNDGDLDIALTGRYGSFDFRSVIYRNDGDNNFTLVELDVEGLRYSMIEWADYDNDGDLDLFITGSYDNNEPSVLHILRNDGDDVFTNVNANNRVLGVRQGDMKVHDLNNNGQLDIIMNGVHSNDSWIGYYYLNQGNDTFTFIDSLVSLKYGQLSFTDFDNDLDSDVILTGRYANEDYVSALFENFSELQNTQPLPPTEISAEVDEDMVTLNWNRGDDAETPSLALNYNIRVGRDPAGHDIFSPLATDDGFLLKPHAGNMLNSLGTTISGLPNGTYYASVQAIDNSFVGSEFSAEISFEITESSVNADDMSPMLTRLQGNYPNPFNPTTTIAFDLAAETQVKLEVYNAKGQKVKTVLQENLAAGAHSIVWDGKDSNNRAVASGVYFYQLQAADYTKTKKMMLLK